MSLSDEIATMITSMTGNNHPPQIVEITKAYSNKTCDVKNEIIDLKRIECSGLAVKGTKGLLTYQEGKSNHPFVLLFEDGENTIQSLGLGKFTIDKNGDLYVELPNNSENIFSIDNNGDLYVELDTGIINNYSIDETGDAVYERWDF